MRKASGVLEDESTAVKGKVEWGDRLRITGSGLSVQVGQLGLATERVSVEQRQMSWWRELHGQI